MTDLFKPLDPYGCVDAGYYRHKAQCDNCYEGFSIQIKKGNRIPGTMTCPNCECETDGNVWKDRV